MSPPAGSVLSQIGHYRILRRLGQGGMGTVYLAEDTKLDRQVALKVCHLVNKPDALARFRREAQAMASLRHPNLCPVFDFDVRDGVSYFTMAFIEGPTLDQWIQQRGGLSQRDAALLIRKLAIALHAAHEKGVIHRDLKPSNIAMDRTEPIVLDFGLARQEGTTDRKFTQDGAILGTPSYMSPEQVEGKPEAMGPASDIYSLGVILYELLTGRVPFEGPVTTILALILTREPLPPRSVQPTIDPALESICLKCLAKKPEERWASMQELAKALTEWARAAPGKRAAAGAQAASGSPVATLQTGSHVKPPLPPTAVKDNNSVLRSRAGETTAPLPAPSRLESPRRWREKRRNRTSLAIAGGLAALLLVLLGIVLATRPPTDRSKAIAQERNPPTKDAKLTPPDLTEPKTTPPESKQGLPAPGTAKDGETAPPRPSEQLFKNSLGMEFVLVPKGTFPMGGSLGNVGSNEVTIPHDFYLGKYEVTQGEWEAVMGSNPSHFRRGGGGTPQIANLDVEELKRFPVELVSWSDTQTFLSEMNKKTKEAGWTYRLPTEAEWEYACRGGPQANRAEYGFDYYISKPAKQLLEEEANTNLTGLNRPVRVGSYKPNRLGLHDMHGNVWEWCDGEGTQRAFRGGSWFTPPHAAQAANRLAVPLTSRGPNTGFRVARVPTAPNAGAPMPVAPGMARNLALSATITCDKPAGNADSIGGSASAPLRAMLDGDPKTECHFAATRLPVVITLKWDRQVRATRIKLHGRKVGINDPIDEGSLELTDPAGKSVWSAPLRRLSSNTVAEYPLPADCKDFTQLSLTIRRGRPAPGLSEIEVLDDTVQAGTANR